MIFSSSRVLFFFWPTQIRPTLLYLLYMGKSRAAGAPLRNHVVSGIAHGIVQTVVVWVECPDVILSINHHLPVKLLCTYFSLLLIIYQYIQQYWPFYHSCTAKEGWYIFSWRQQQVVLEYTPPQSNNKIQIYDLGEWWELPAMRDNINATVGSITWNPHYNNSDFFFGNKLKKNIIRAKRVSNSHLGYTAI